MPKIGNDALYRAYILYYSFVNMQKIQSIFKSKNTLYKGKGHHKGFKKLQRVEGKNEISSNFINELF